MLKKHSQTNQENGTQTKPALDKPKRRAFSATYKLGILEEADQATATGEIGALLRREGLYSSHLAEWRKQRRQGQLQALSPTKRGRKVDEKTAEMTALRQENARLQSQLAQATLIIEAQKKLSQALQTLMTTEAGN
jgi:hypothetical protein